MGGWYLLKAISNFYTNYNNGDLDAGINELEELYYGYNEEFDFMESGILTGPEKAILPIGDLSELILPDCDQSQKSQSVGSLDLGERPESQQSLFWSN